MIRSGYPKQNGKSYVRAHGRGQHDDNYMTPETPLKIRQERKRASELFGRDINEK